MTDIVERLRAIKKLPLGLQTVTDDAADEIERLRVLLLDAAECIGDERCSHYPHHCGPDVKGCCVSDLYRALKDKP